MKKLLSTLFAAITLSTAPLMLEAKVETGASAPDFTLNDSQGKEHSLSEFKGDYVVLEWTNHQCPFVVKHYRSENMQELQKSYTEKGVVWLSIVSSAPGEQGHVTAEQANKLIQENGAQPTAYLFDSDGAVGRLYGAKTTPHMFVINPEGELIYQGAIDSIRSADSADIDKADNYVVNALEEAMAGKPVSLSETRPYGCGVKYAKR